MLHLKTVWQKLRLRHLLLTLPLLIQTRNQMRSECAGC